MVLATTVSIVVICVMVVVGVIGFVIDRHADKLDASS
jgi:preprotein translocase subunit Sss1